MSNFDDAVKECIEYSLKSVPEGVLHYVRTGWLGEINSALIKWKLWDFERMFGTKIVHNRLMRLLKIDQKNRIPNAINNLMVQGLAMNFITAIQREWMGCLVAAKRKRKEEITLEDVYRTLSWGPLNFLMERESLSVAGKTNLMGGDSPFIPFEPGDGSSGIGPITGS